MNNIVKPSKPPFRAQETPDSCVPACLRMLFAAYGVNVAEHTLRELCDCTFMGTDALKAVQVARDCGFHHAAKHTLTMTELDTLVPEQTFPIVYLDLGLIDGNSQPHAVVVVETTPFSIVVLDPAVGERLIPREDFAAAWKWRHHLAILILP